MSNSHSPYESSQTTHTTMSSLTTPGEGMGDMAGDCGDDDLVFGGYDGHGHTFASAEECF